MSEMIELASDFVNPQTALLIYLEDDNFEDFLHILQRNDGESIDVNHLYRERQNSLLEIACSCKNKAKFVELLLQYGADANRTNKLTGKAPIHLAALHSDFDTFKLLVEHEFTDINKPDISDHTALHLATQQGKEDFVRLLQKQATFEAHQNDDRFQTSINIDKRGENRPLVQTKDCLDSTSNTIVVGDNPNFSLQSEGDPPRESLMTLLFAKNFEAFAIEANENNVHHDKHARRLTYLQHACKCGLAHFVRLLLDLKVDPNETSLPSRKPPIMIAAYNGHYDIVKMLVDTRRITYSLVDGDNILHTIFVGDVMRDRQGESNNRTYGNKHQDFYKCLEHLLDNVPNSQLDVNLLNRKGKTVLHYAVLADNRDVIRLLVEKGAYIGVTNAKGEMPLKFMKAATLAYFLDTAITSKRHSLRKDHRIILDYNLLVCKCLDPSTVTETRPLVAISEVPQLRPHLTHPLFTAFLDLKWYIIMNKLTIVNYFFYTLFVLFLSSYLLIAYVPITNEVQNNTTSSQNNTLTASQNKTTPINMYSRGHQVDGLHITLWYLVLILNSILFLREFLQLVIYSTSNKYRYIKNPENWIEVALITITYVILFCRIDATENRSLLSVTAIFLSWIELMLLILSHPITSVHITMFKAVAWNSFKFLLCYLILILAFALSFYLLFKDTSPEFEDIVLSIFKTGVMSTGEYDVSNHPFNSQPGMRHLLFVLFIFLVPIVLFNLLNGVAISDIQRIRNDAELVSTVARVRLIAHMEEIVSDLLAFLDTLAYHYSRLIRWHSDLEARERCNKLRHSYHRYINLFSTLSDDGKVYITPNQSNAIFIKSRKSAAPTDTSKAKNSMPKLFITASAIETIKEKLTGRADNREKVNHCEQIPEISQTVTNLQEAFKSQSMWVQNASERTDERLQIIEQKLAEISSLLREKL